MPSFLDLCFCLSPQELGTAARGQPCSLYSGIKAKEVLVSGLLTPL